MRDSKTSRMKGQVFLGRCDVKFAKPNVKEDDAINNLKLVVTIKVDMDKANGALTMKEMEVLAHRCLTQGWNPTADGIVISEMEPLNK
jgi:hypothetical protein